MHPLKIAIKCLLNSSGSDISCGGDNYDNFFKVICFKTSLNTVASYYIAPHWWMKLSRVYKKDNHNHHKMWIIQRTYQYRISVNALEFMHESILHWDDKAKPLGFIPPTLAQPPVKMWAALGRSVLSRHSLAAETVLRKLLTGKSSQQTLLIVLKFFLELGFRKWLHLSQGW